MMRIYWILFGWTIAALLCCWFYSRMSTLFKRQDEALFRSKDRKPPDPDTPIALFQDGFGNDRKGSAGATCSFILVLVAIALLGLYVGINAQQMGGDDPLFRYQHHVN